ncbi:MAG: hypothetical protein OEO20_07230 [Gemmatimonadota bacterium]|nr:hypothetical protein [Gemmatimonadota bacterium]MDH3366682.1 hypothetical protein [Gemmatimonadota bacterium]MDH3478081.1 hypothetical protein [Gemmatimonadota bacterium]MDH3569271.1 hypothetical protein [Gemmatimonadota bacterium]MDH5550018.1 hypothetical protein [Gemmatimonadota bacterium]
MSNCSRHLLRSAIVAIVSISATAPSGHAQVGHPPGSSPYRDLRSKYQVSLTGGYSWGTGGKVEVGPARGRFGGMRFDLHLAGPGAVQLGVNVGDFDRLLLDPSQAPDARVLGTAKQSIIMVDAGLNLVLTGAKTWYGFAPYAGASLGLALGGDVPAADTLSVFKFSTKFLVGPQIGFRWFPIERISLRFEARDVIWRLTYPNQFFDPPANALDDDPVLDARFNKPTQWTHNPMFLVSVGWAFGR